jgi:sister-chromatid-cohesion protein PDS5
MASSSGVIPDVSPSQVLSVSPSLPTNKLIDNLTKNQRLLQSLPQNYEKKQSFTTLYKTLLDDFFYSHERADVQLYAAICLADVIRIWAPNLPDAPPEKLLNMFLFLARQLLGLKNIDDSLFSRRYYLLENLSMVQSFIPAVNLEDNRGCQISTVVLNNIFNAVQKNHTDQLKNLMIDIISVILAEYESIPFSLLELLFTKIIEPEKNYEKNVMN